MKHVSWDEFKGTVYLLAIPGIMLSVTVLSYVGYKLRAHCARPKNVHHLQNEDVEDKL